MKINKIYLLISVVLLGLIGGCFGNNEDDNVESGTLVMSISDAPVNDVKNVFVTLEKVEVHSEENGWVLINDFENEENGELKVDLLELRFDEKLLGQKDLEAGNYNQIRLYVAAKDQDETGSEVGKSYIVNKDDTEEGIFIPSGTQSGLKINYNFEIKSGEVKRLLLDNDVSEILNNAGNSGKIILRPTAIKIIDKIISGDVTGKVVADIDGDNTYTAITNSAILAGDIEVSAIDSNGDIAAQTVATIENLSTEEGTKEAGSFLLRGLEEGAYTIEASATVDGVVYSVEKSVDVVAETTTDIGDLKIEEESVNVEPTE